LLGKLAELRAELTATALAGLTPEDAQRLVRQMQMIKENLRGAIQHHCHREERRREERYG
ncbi:MAG: MarR family transcriptional regulator, partial [Pseudomonadota bacterium]